MDRRVWIKQITIAGGAMLLLPACWHDKGAISVSLKNIELSDEEEAMVADVVEAIIPETETSGARTLNLHQFLLKMIDDCYSRENQQKFLGGLRELNGFAKNTMSFAFNELGSDGQLTLLYKIREDKPSENLAYFFTGNPTISNQRI